MGEINPYKSQTLRTTYPKSATFDSTLAPLPYDAMEIVSRDGSNNPTQIDYYQTNPFYTGSLNFTGSYATFSGRSEFVKVMTSYMAYTGSLIQTIYTVKQIGDVLNDSAIQ